MKKAMMVSFVAGVALILSGSAPATPAAPAAQDARTPIELPAEAREVVLGEMRLMLEALNGILAGMAAGDREAMREAALGGGTAVAVDMDPGIAARLPDAFKSLGQGTHVAFDSLASAIGQGADRDAVLRRLSGLTGNCVACHDTYRIVVP